jgi:branched-chain amino acid transport system permease protein
MAMLNSAFSLALYFTWKTGHISVGQAGFMGMSAYTSAILSKSLMVNVWLSILIGGIVSAILGFLIGWLVLRIRGAYFVLATFAFAEVLVAIWMYFVNPFGGPAGITRIPKPSIAISGLIQFNFALVKNYYYLVLVFAALTFFVVYRLGTARFGMTSEATADAELLAESLGVPTLRHKVNTFTITSLITGTGGALLAHYLTVITPHTFGFVTSVNLLIYCVVGGVSTVLGPILGATILTVVGDYLFFIGAWKEVVFGAVLLLSIRFIPKGLESAAYGLWASVNSQIRGK